MNRSSYSLLRKHLLAVLFLSFLEFLFTFILQLAEIGWVSDGRFRLICLVHFSQRGKVGRLYQISIILRYSKTVKPYLVVASEASSLAS